MKQLIFVLMATIATLGAKSQKDFEGKVVYLMEADKDEKKPELTVCFAPGKLKISFKEGIEPDQTYLLVWIDSGKIINVNTSTRQYKTRKLNVLDPTPFTPEKKTIAGHPTTSAKNENNSPTGALGGLITLQDMILDVSDDMQYTIPNNLVNNPELLMVRNNRIVLGATMRMGSAFASAMSDNDDESIIKKITATAISVMPMRFTADEFTLPEGFIPQPKYEKGSMDSVIYDTAISVMADSIVFAPPSPKKPTKKPAKKPASKKTGTKSAAYRKQ
jgi:hypothetical protein